MSQFQTFSERHFEHFMYIICCPPCTPHVIFQHPAKHAIDALHHQIKLNPLFFFCKWAFLQGLYIWIPMSPKMFRFFNKAPHVPCGESILFQFSVLSDLRNILGHLPYKVFTTKSFSPQNVNSSILSVRKTSHGLRAPWSPWLADCTKLLSKPWRPWRWHAWGKTQGTGNLSSNWNRVHKLHVVLDEVVTVAFVNMHPCWNP